MAWVRFDDGFFRHPKVVTAGRDARDLYMASVFYANSNLTDGFIPSGALRLIAADAGIGSHAKATKALIEVRLWVTVDGGYQIHDYLEYQASAESVTASREANAKRQEEYRKRRRNGASNAKSNAKSNAVTNAPVTAPPINIPNPKAPLEPSESKDSPTRASSISERFAEFWSAYPKKAGKGDAEAKFKRIRWSEVSFADLMAALDRQKQSAQWQADGGRFIPNPSTWINQKRWGDELPIAGESTDKSGNEAYESLLKSIAEDEKREHRQPESRSQEANSDSVSGMAEGRVSISGGDIVSVLPGGAGLRTFARRSG